MVISAFISPGCASLRHLYKALQHIQFSFVYNKYHHRVGRVYCITDNFQLPSHSIPPEIEPTLDTLNTWRTSVRPISFPWYSGSSSPVAKAASISTIALNYAVKKSNICTFSCSAKVLLFFGSTGGQKPTMMAFEADAKIISDSVVPRMDEF